jgi:hypothetical protein
LLEARLIEGLDRDLFCLVSYVDSIPVSGNASRLIKELVSVAVMLIAVVLTTLLLYLSIADLYKKKLAIRYLHGSGIYASLLPFLLISLTANIVLGYYSLGVAKDIFRPTTTLQLSAVHLIFVLAFLCVLELVLWLVVSKKFKNKPAQILNKK